MRNNRNISFISGTLAPRRYDEVQFVYSEDGTVTISRFYANGTFLCQVRSIADSEGREIIVRLENELSGF